MAIFIRYNHRDRAFADALAQGLVVRNINVWIDRWELKVGDSLISKVQQALTSSSAILVIVSKHSVESNWCRREVSAGLLREIESENNIVLPIVIDDCEIPLFIREKKYADFRADPKQALEEVCVALAAVSNPFLGRVNSNDHRIDWGIDFKLLGNRFSIHWTFVTHGETLPYTILSSLNIYCNESATQRCMNAAQRGRLHVEITRILGKVLDCLKVTTVHIDSHFERGIPFKFEDRDKCVYDALLKYRRLGIDNGMTTVFHFDDNLREALKHTAAMVRESQTE